MPASGELSNSSLLFLADPPNFSAHIPQQDRWGVESP